MARRTQQQAVYTAQNAVPVGRSYASHDEIQQLLDELRDSYWWPEGLYRVEVQVLPDRNRHLGIGGWDAAAGAGAIALRRDGLNQRTVAHELAHVLADKDGSSSHDPLFCRKYLETVYHIMGPDAYVQLQQSFIKHNIVFDPTERTQDGEGN